MVVAQLAERSLLTPGDTDSNLAISNFFYKKDIYLMSTLLNRRKLRNRGREMPSWRKIDIRNET